MTDAPPLKPVMWIGSSRKDLRALPAPVQDYIGYGLHLAQLGGKHRDAKTLSGFGGASVQEIIVDYDCATYRAVYTVRFADRIYVLHAFKKKSKSGIATPKSDRELIERRLKQAQEMEKDRRRK
jgi:phage-related protein